jgi:exopolysaccharide production protein ExoZ
MSLGVAAALVAFSIVVFAAVSFTGVAEFPRFLVYGLPSALFVAGLVSLEPLVQRWPAKSLALIGDASYSLYLSHPFVLKGVSIAFGSVGLGVGDSPLIAVLFAVAAIACAVIFSILSYQLIERPLGRVLTRALVGRRGNLVPASAGTGAMV